MAKARRSSVVGLSRPNSLAFIGPAFVLVIGLYFVPLLLNGALSFFNWTAFSPDIRWIGFANYEQLDQNDLLIPTLQRSLIYTFLSCTLMLLGSLGLALALESDLRRNRILRTVFFIPLLLSPLTIAFVFTALLRLDGTVNWLISLLAARPVQIPWLGSTEITLPVLSVIIAWSSAPLLFVVFLAGLAAIPPQLIEAARLDGAGHWALLRHVKLPLLGPAITFNVVIAIIVALSVFETVYVITSGGPGRSTQVLNFLVVREFAQGRYGSAAALSTVLYGAIFLLAVPLVALLRRREVQL